MSFALGLWLLFGFFANIPTASSIQCYACLDFPGSIHPCEGSSAIQCESFFDSCITIKIKVEFAGIDFDETLKNCYIAESPGCNQTYACELIANVLAEVGGKLLECEVTCCHTDKCNGPDEGEPKPSTPGSNPHSELKYYIKTVRALLDELEYIADSDLEGQLSATKYKERVKEVLDDFYLAITNEEPNADMDELKTNPAKFMKKLETMRGQSKKKRQKKIDPKTYQLLSEAMKRLAREAAQKR